MSIGDDQLRKFNEVVMEETKVCLCVSVCVFVVSERQSCVC